MSGQRGQRVMGEASRGLCEGCAWSALKRLLGVLCHSGASPEALAEAARAERREMCPGSIRGDVGTNLLILRRLGTREGARSERRCRAALPVPTEELIGANCPAQISPFSPGRRFWVRWTLRAQAAPRGSAEPEEPRPGGMLARPRMAAVPRHRRAKRRPRHEAAAPARSPGFKPSSLRRRCRGCSRAPALGVTLITFPN